MYKTLLFQCTDDTNIQKKINKQYVVENFYKLLFITSVYTDVK